MLDLQAITLLDLRRETAKDGTLSKLIAQIQKVKWSHNGKLKPFKTIKDELSLYEGVILRGNRIVVPFLLRFPEELVSDYNKQFVSAEFETFLKSCGIKHARVSLLCKKQCQAITFSQIP